MLEQPSEPTGAKSVLRIVAGVFLGLMGGTILSAGVFMFTMPVVASLGDKGTGKFAVGLISLLDLGLLAFLGYLAYQNMRHSALARGLLIGLSISFLINTICGVAMVSSF